MNFEEAMERYIEYVSSVRGLSERTLDSYRRDLSKFLSFFSDESDTVEGAWNEIGSRDVRRFISYLFRLNLKESSVNRILSSLRGFYSFCRKFDYVSVDPFSSVKGVKGERRLPEVLSENEMDELLALPEDDFLGTRDRALFELLYSTGSRVSEVEAMNIADVEKGKKSIRVLGKGNKERYVFLGQPAQESLQMYISMRKEHVKAHEPDAEKALFLNAQGRRLTRRGISEIISRYLVTAANAKNISPHTFRHSFATHMVNRGVDIRVVQELLGHSSVSTTQVYTHVGIERLRDVYSRAHPHAAAHKHYSPRGADTNAPGDKGVNSMRTRKMRTRKEEKNDE